MAGRAWGGGRLPMDCARRIVRRAPRGLKFPWNRGSSRAWGGPGWFDLVHGRREGMAAVIG